MKPHLHRLALLLLLTLTGCATVHQGPVFHTLAGNPRLQEDLIREFYTEERWKEVRDTPYDGYVIYRGRIERDRSITPGRIIESYPDKSRDKAALSFGRDILLSPVRAGSRVSPSAEVFVVFYETGIAPNKALVFARQTGAFGASSALGGTIYFVVWTYNRIPGPEQR